MKENEQKFSFKSLFVPLTTLKAIHIIVIVGLIVFFNVLFNGFVWDDSVYIINNADVRSLNIFYLFGPNSFNNGLYYRPLGAIYFTILYSLFGNIAFFYHFFQILFHIISTILVFLVFKNFFNKLPSLLLSLIFLIHPIQVESVAFIAASLNPLSLIFGLSALILSFKDIINQKRFLLIFFCLLTSILLRETGVLFLIFVLLYQALFKFKKREIVLFFIIDGVISLAYFFLRIFIGHVDFKIARAGVVPIAGLDLVTRIQNIPAIIFYYIKTFLLPINLAIDQQWTIDSINLYTFYLPLLFDFFVIFSIVLLGVLLFRKKEKIFNIFLFFCIWFLLALAFHSQIFPLDMTVADRFFYFTLIGLLGLIGALINVLDISNKNTNQRIIIFTGVIILIIILSIRTIVRNANWSDEISLYTHDSKIYDSFNVENNLGSIYYNVQSYNNALIYYRKSAEIYPTEINYFNTGITYERLGNLQKAKEYLENALKLNKYPSAEHKIILTKTARELAFVYLLLNQNEIGKNFIKTWLVEFPQDEYLWSYLAVSEYKLGNQKEAVIDIEKAKSYSPNNIGINNIYTYIINKQQIKLEYK